MKKLLLFLAFSLPALSNTLYTRDGVYVQQWYQEALIPEITAMPDRVMVFYPADDPNSPVMIQAPWNIRVVRKIIHDPDIRMVVMYGFTYPEFFIWMSQHWTNPYTYREFAEFARWYHR